jgi:hypothetical protein
MNLFTVEWEPDAEDTLARIWLTAPDPDAVTRAQARADQLLARNPTGHGRHLHEGVYRLDVPPLAVVYTVDGRRAGCRWSQWYSCPDPAPVNGRRS